MAVKFGRAVGKYGCLSNFYSCVLTFDGITYINSESAWQAQKTLDEAERRGFSNLTPALAKRKGRRVKLREDWESIKYGLMVDVLTAKFTQNAELREVLLGTGDEEIMENTTGWHDNIWGSCSCPECSGIVGKNLLGKALMEVRENLRKEGF